jgi:hypothetical protein
MAKPGDYGGILSPRGLNTRKYFWVIMGYWLFTVYLRSSHAIPDSNANSHMVPGDPGFPGAVGETSTHSDPDHTEGEKGGHSEHGIRIVKIDFENVETPFIIAMWIFCASLAKIGKAKFNNLSFFVLLVLPRVF